MEFPFLYFFYERKGFILKKKGKEADCRKDASHAFEKKKKKGHKVYKVRCILK